MLPICKICSSQKVKFLFYSKDIHGRNYLSNNDFDVFECQNCRVVFVDIIANSEYYRKYYVGEYYNNFPSSMLAKKILSFLRKVSFMQKLRLINRYKPQESKILEIGCAKGNFLEMLPTSFQKYGVEISETGYQYTKKHCKNVLVYNFKIEDKRFDKKIKYDIIVMWHVFEHLDNPIAFLKILSEILAKDGVFIIEIPNKNSIGFRLTQNAWFFMDTPRHLFHYSYDSLKYLLQKYDLEIIAYRANVIDYFQDLSNSFYMKLKTKYSFLNIVISVLVVPPALVIRFLAALFIPKIAEVNTYIIKHKSS